MRNYQARNFMRDDMRVGDGVLFYASNADPAGVTGVARICREGYPDHYAWEPGHRYFDARSTAEKPVWYMVEIEYVERFPGTVGLAALKAAPRAGADDGGPQGQPAVGPAGHGSGIRKSSCGSAGRSARRTRRSSRRPFSRFAPATSAPVPAPYSRITRRKISP